MVLTEVDFRKVDKNIVRVVLESSETIWAILCNDSGPDVIQELKFGNFFVNIRDGKIFKVLFKIEGGYGAVKRIGIKSGISIVSFIKPPSPPEQERDEGDVVTIMGFIEVGYIKEEYIWSDIGSLSMGE